MQNNQQLNIQLQEIIITQNNAAAIRGDYIPRLDAEVGAGLEKPGEYTAQGVEHRAHNLPRPLADFRFGFVASWETDIWSRLRNLRRSALLQYEATIQERNFLVTEIVAEIASLTTTWSRSTSRSRSSIATSSCRRTRSRSSSSRSWPRAAPSSGSSGSRPKCSRTRAGSSRSSSSGSSSRTASTSWSGGSRSPSRATPDLHGRQARRGGHRPALGPAGEPPRREGGRARLEASKLDTKSAKARFYPSLRLDAGIGFESFNLQHLIDPRSLAYNIAGGLVAPLLNRTAIKADYRSANARQVQAVFEYERSILQAYTDVYNQLTALSNFRQRYEQLAGQVAALRAAIETSKALYQSAQADYNEVLMTTRDSLEAEIDLVEAQKDQMQAVVAIHQALGGGWRQNQ
nr:TolC family protein [Nannocystis pusilla]